MRLTLRYWAGTCGIERVYVRGHGQVGAVWFDRDGYHCPEGEGAVRMTAFLREALATAGIRMTGGPADWPAVLALAMRIEDRVTRYHERQRRASARSRWWWLMCERAKLRVILAACWIGRAVLATLGMYRNPGAKSVPTAPRGRGTKTR